MDIKLNEAEACSHPKRTEVWRTPAYVVPAIIGFRCDACAEKFTEKGIEGKKDLDLLAELREEVRSSIEYQELHMELGAKQSEDAISVKLSVDTVRRLIG